jgi:uncharacterized membrane protein
MSVEPVAVHLERSRRPAGRVLEWCLAHRWPLVVWTAMAAWSLVLFGTVRNDYLRYQVGRFDLGNMVQAVWATAHGDILQTTNANGDQIVRLASHVDPILVFFAPLWWIVPSPLTLVAVQVSACALGALPVFWFARRRLALERTAALMALAYLAYPWLAWSAWDPIHPVTLAIPLFLFAIWFLDDDRLVPFAVCAALAAMTGELVGLSIAALGIWYTLAHRRRVAGGLITVLGVSWTVFAVKVVVPSFLGHNSVYYGQYEAVGGSPGGVARTLVTEPSAFFSQLLSGDDLVYWFWLAIPLLGLFALAPWLAVVAIPQLLVNGLARAWPMTDPRFHYVAGVIPFIVMASVLGLHRLSAKGQARGAASALVASTALLAALGPLPGSSPLEDRTGALTDRHVSALNEAVALVPSDARVSFTNGLGSHLSARRYAYLVPVLKRANWAILDLDNSWMFGGPGGATTYPARLAAFRHRLDRSADWKNVFERDNVVVFRKLGDG